MIAPFHQAEILAKRTAEYFELAEYYINECVRTAGMIDNLISGSNYSHKEQIMNHLCSRFMTKEIRKLSEMQNAVVELQKVVNETNGNQSRAKKNYLMNIQRLRETSKLGRTELFRKIENLLCMGLSINEVYEETKLDHNKIERIIDYHSWLIKSDSEYVHDLNIKSYLNTFPSNQVRYLTTVAILLGISTGKVEKLIKNKILPGMVVGYRHCIVKQSDLIKYTDNDKSHQVYLMKTDGDIYKVGVSSNPGRRLKTFQSSSPLTNIQIEILSEQLYKRVAYTFETELIGEFAEYCVKGNEWFKFNREQARLIKDRIANYRQLPILLAAT